MKKLFPVTLIGTTLNMLVTTPKFKQNGRDVTTTALNFTVGANVDVGGKEMPSFLPVRGIGYECESVLREIRGAGSEHGLNGVNVMVHGVYVEEDYRDERGHDHTIQYVRLLQAMTVGQHHETVLDTNGNPRMRYGEASVHVAGNATVDATVTQVQLSEGSGSVPLGEIRLALNSEKRVRDPQKPGGFRYAPVTEFVNVKAWRGHAQQAASVRRGKPVMVTGTLRNDSFWKDVDYQSEPVYVQRLCVEASRILSREQGVSSRPAAAPRAAVTPRQAASPRPLPAAARLASVTPRANAAQPAAAKPSAASKPRAAARPRAAPAAVD